MNLDLRGPVGDHMIGSYRFGLWRKGWQSQQGKREGRARFEDTETLQQHALRHNIPRRIGCSSIGEDDRYRWELQEGNLVMPSNHTPRHMIASRELRDQLKSQLPPHLRVIQDVDIDMQLAPTDQPGWSRRAGQSGGGYAASSCRSVMV
jgi:hypothetical protein